jgi:hypothetical protein
MADSARTSVQEKLIEVKRHCLLSVELGVIESEIKHAIEGKPERIAAPAKVFLENINVAITTITILHTFAKTSILSSLFHQLVTRHRILADSDSLTVENMSREPTPEEEVSHSKIAHEQALVEFQNRLNDRLERGQLFEKSCDYLLDVLQNKQMETAAEELWRQAIVMIWGAFEVLCKDTFAGQDLHKHLRNPRLWLLQQRRHLIVHRRGVVDKQYLENTGEKIKVGEQLTPTPTEIEEYVRHVCDAALALVKAANKS